MTFTRSKAKITITIEESTDERLRAVAFKHRKTVNLSTLTEAMILHCLNNPHIIKKLTKKEEEIDYPI